MFSETLKVTGDVFIYKDGVLIREIKNLVVATGKNFIAGRLGTSPPSQMTHMAIGAPSTVLAPLPSDVALTTEIARVAVSPAGGTSLNNTVTYVATFPAGVGTNPAIAEAGIFSASSSGTMLCRTTFASINKAVGESVVIVWVITIS